MAQVGDKVILGAVGHIRFLLFTGQVKVKHFDLLGPGLHQDFEMRLVLSQISLDAQGLQTKGHLAGNFLQQVHVRLAEALRA